MAQNESDREDLMAEMVSLIRRIECCSPDGQLLAVVGFNALGWLFVYRGHDLMYRFDAQKRLRRAYVDGLLYRTEGKTLAQLKRHREHLSDEPGSSPTTSLIRRDLSSSDVDQFRERVHADLRQVLSDIQGGVITRRLPETGDELLPEIETSLNDVLQSPQFLAPAIVRRKR
ncbi:hypothetical protein [Schlesneria sp. DSM 10557]|uniref:hypothetical protein n=1 Tax=Schlesneria sp. DSM 10557 TaxID=3044399 RepID=UPI0035A1401F